MCLKGHRNLVRYLQGFIDLPCHLQKVPIGSQTYREEGVSYTQVLEISMLFTYFLDPAWQQVSTIYLPRYKVELNILKTNLPCANCT